MAQISIYSFLSSFLVMGGDGGGDRHIYNKKQTVHLALSAEGEN